MTTTQLQQATTEIANWLEWDRQMIDDFHRYAHRFGAAIGSNVYEFVLRDALRGRSLTMEQFREEGEQS